MLHIREMLYATYKMETSLYVESMETLGLIWQQWEICPGKEERIEGRREEEAKPLSHRHRHCLVSDDRGRGEHSRPTRLWITDPGK